MRLTVLLFFLCLSCVGFSGCGEARPSTSTSSPGQPPSEEVIEVAMGELRAGDPPHREALVREVSGTSTVRHRYAVPMTAGDVLHLIAEQHGLDVKVEGRRPDGALVLRVDSPSGRDGEEELWLWAEATGVHAVVVEATPPKGEEDAAYRLRVEKLGPGGAEERERARATRLLAAAEELRRQGSREAREEAVPLYRQAIEIWQRRDQPERLAFTWKQLGRVLEAQDRTRAALEALEQAMLGYLMTGDREQQARLHIRLGEHRRKLTDADAAEAHFLTAFDLWEGSPTKQATSLNSLASLAGEQGRVAEAERYYNDAIRRWEADGSGRDAAIGHLNLAHFWARLGEAEAARAALAEAEDWLPNDAEIGDRAYLHETHARVFIELEEYGEARREYERARKLREKAGDAVALAYLLQSLARLEYRVEEYEAAERLYSEAFTILQAAEKTADAAAILQNLGWVHYRRGDLDGARRKLRRGLEEAAGNDLPGMEASAYLGLAHVERDAGQLEAARAHALAAIERIEGLRERAARLDLRTSVFASYQSYFDVAVDVLIRMAEEAARQGAENEAEAYRAEAYGVSESARGRRLLELLPTSWSRPPESAEKRQQRGALARAVRDAGDELARQRAVTALRAFEAEGLADVASKAAGAASLQSPGEVQRQLLAGSSDLLLHYDLGEERSFLWAIGAEFADLHELPAGADIEKTARQVHRLLRESKKGTSREELEAGLEELSHILLAPVARRLRPGSSLLLVPEGAIGLVPFEALPLPASLAPRETGAETGGSAGASRTKAIRADLPDGATARVFDRHRVTYLPSASVGAWMRRQADRRRPAAIPMAIFADPIPSKADPRYGRLEHARDEARAIADLLPTASSRLWLAEEATPEAATSGELADFDGLHFASHGELNTEYPELAALILSPGGTPGSDTGRLSAHDIGLLRLRARLAVLSACETALGKETAGEGRIGLPQAFMQAGAVRVVVSLWRVDDRATVDFMRRFYEHLLRDGLPPDEALRRARRWMARESRWRHPYYWAPFVLMGAAPDSSG